MLNINNQSEQRDLLCIGIAEPAQCNGNIADGSPRPSLMKNAKQMIGQQFSFSSWLNGNLMTIAGAAILIGNAIGIAKSQANATGFLMMPAESIDYVVGNLDDTLLNVFLTAEIFRHDL